MTLTEIPKITETIAGLLAKSEASEFPAEAESFLNKALDLMAKHSIDEAMLDSVRTPEERTQVVIADPVLIPSPYPIHKSVLFMALAEANDCRYYHEKLWKDGSKNLHGILMGTPADIANATALFHSLLIHLQRDLNNAKDAYGQTKGYRIHFIGGFTEEISHRLAMIKRASREQAEAEVAEVGGNSTSVGLALIDKKAYVSDKADELLQERGIKLRTTRHAGPTGGWGGSSAGRESGRRADLGGSRLGGQKGLPA